MKTVLVVDIGNDEYLLNKKINAICFEDGDKIYDNFNFLKPMPKKADIEKYRRDYYVLGDKSEFKTAIQYAMCKGYNGCIERILGETE